MEKADLILNGAKDTIKAILPVVDDLERALAHMSDDDASKEGVQLIYNKLMKTLEQKGLKPIEAKDQKFDENLHEAVTQFPATDESQKGMVVDVVEKGYYLNDKVLRYAKVVVAI
jgi:molecular chaperone GrpE